MTRGQNNEAHHGFVGIISVGVVVVRSVGKWQFWMFQVTRSSAGSEPGQLTNPMNQGQHGRALQDRRDC